MENSVIAPKQYIRLIEVIKAKRLRHPFAPDSLSMRVGDIFDLYSNEGEEQILNSDVFGMMKRLERESCIKITNEVSDSGDPEAVLDFEIFLERLKEYEVELLILLRDNQNNNVAELRQDINFKFKLENGTLVHSSSKIISTRHKGSTRKLLDFLWKNKRVIIGGETKVQGHYQETDFLCSTCGFGSKDSLRRTIRRFRKRFSNFCVSADIKNEKTGYMLILNND